jgi:hypothetical protein
LVKRVVRFGVYALLVVACKRTTVAATDAGAGAYGPEAPDAMADAMPDATADATATGVPVGGALDPYAEVPVLDNGGTLLLPERIVGFSSDDRYLGYEISVCDPCPSEFHFRGPGRPPIDLKYFWDPSLDEEVAEKRRKAEDAFVEKKLTALGATPAKLGKKLRGPFPYRDLVFAAKDSRDASQRVSLLVGAHLPDEEPVFPMRIELGMHPMRTSVKPTDPQFSHLPPAERDKQVAEVIAGFDFNEAQLAYINVTKDGREIGAVAEVSGSYWFENGGIARMPTGSFVAQIYNDTGMRKLTKNDNGAAANLFAKAEAADPESPVHAYNLACAAARLRDATRAELALARAIKKRDAYRERARHDHDFDGVRSDPWFVALTR